VGKRDLQGKESKTGVEKSPETFCSSDFVRQKEEERLKTVAEVKKVLGGWPHLKKKKKSQTGEFLESLDYQRGCEENSPRGGKGGP